MSGTRTSLMLPKEIHLKLLDEQMEYFKQTGEKTTISKLVNDALAKVYGKKEGENE